MNIAKLFGLAGEDLATSYLKKNKYKILERNYTVKLGEIDIIAKDKDEIVFVEVKRRKNDDFGRPSENVDYKKQKKITAVAEFYMSKNEIESYTRFDVIEIVGDEISHIKNAFYAVY